METGLMDLWAQMGGVARSVVLTLLVMSMFSLWVFADRVIYFSNARRQSKRLLTALNGVLGGGDVQRVLAVTGTLKQSHLAKVVEAGLREFRASTSSRKSYNFEIVVEACRQAMERTALITVAEFKRGLGILATVGATAPFVGLLGTVYGIVNAFRGMAASGSGGIASVSAGIAEALVTTALGLFVAIPAVWVYNYFMSRIERFTVEMANSGSEMTVYFLKELGQEDATPVAGTGS